MVGYESDISALNVIIIFVVNATNGCVTIVLWICTVSHTHIKYYFFSLLSFSTHVGDTTSYRHCTEQPCSYGFTFWVQLRQNIVVSTLNDVIYQWLDMSTVCYQIITMLWLLYCRLSFLILIMGDACFDDSVFKMELHYRITNFNITVLYIYDIYTTYWYFAFLFCSFTTLHSSTFYLLLCQWFCYICML